MTKVLEQIACRSPISLNSMIVTLGSMALVLLFGAMAAWALTEYKFRGSTLLALFLSIGIMVPIRLGSVAIVSMVRQAGLNDTLDGADPRLCRARPADGDLHPLRIHPADPQGSARRCALRRRAGDAHLPRSDRPAPAPGHRHRRGFHDGAGLERPVVSVAPHLERFARIRSRSAYSSSSANTPPTGTACSPRSRSRSCRWSRSTSSSPGN